MSKQTALYVLASIAVVCGSGTVRAQDVQAYERRVDTLHETLNRARDLRRSHDSLSASRVRALDSLGVGPVRFKVSPWAKGYALPAARLAVASLLPQFGRTLDTLTRVTYVVRDELVNDVANHDTTFVLVGEIAADGTVQFSQVVAPQVDLVAIAIRTAMLRSLSRSTDAALMGWLTAVLPHDTADQAEWPRARVELLSSRAAVARRCYAGNVPACRLAFGVATTADPAADLFDAADRRSLVEGSGRRYRGRLTDVAVESCLRGADTACLSLLRNAVLPQPISNVQRRNLVQLALTLGGTNAMERLLMTEGSVERRLSAAAGIPADSLLAIWSSRVRNTMQAPDNMSFSIAGAALGWILVCGSLAARSSRWR